MTCTTGFFSRSAFELAVFVFGLPFALSFAPLVAAKTSLSLLCLYAS